MIGHLLTRTLTVHRPETVSDGAGGQTVSYIEIGDIKCQVSQPSVAEREVAQRDGATLSHVIHALAGADVRRGDELGGDLPSDVEPGHRLRVIATVANSRDTYTRVEAEVTQAEQAGGTS